jgi:hypothetical protein
VDTDVATPPAVQNVLDEVSQYVERQGFSFDTEALDELKELVLSGFRQLQEERVLDLAEDHPERREAVSRARGSLQLFMAGWIETEQAEESTRLQLENFERTRASLCPMYPFE